MSAINTNGLGKNCNVNTYDNMVGIISVQLFEESNKMVPNLMWSDRL